MELSNGSDAAFKIILTEITLAQLKIKDFVNDFNVIIVTITPKSKPKVH